MEVASLVVDRWEEVDVESEEVSVELAGRLVSTDDDVPSSAISQYYTYYYYYFLKFPIAQSHRRRN